MQKTLKTLVAAASMALIVASAVPVSAQTSSVAQIQAMIAQLEAQLQALQGGSSGSCTLPATRNLTVGSSGADVQALQQFLKNKGYLSITVTTQYFGALTKAGLAKFQAANGISPASGYYGPITRAAISSMCSAGGSTGSGSGTGTGTGTGTGPVVSPAGTSMTVSLDASNPPAGALISSSASAAARVPVLTLDFTAGTGSAITINDVKFTKNGVLADSSISGAYLVENGKVIQQYSSVSGGKIDFANPFTVSAGTTRTLTLAIDPATNLSAGNTASFSLASASDITSVDATGNAVSEGGAFPLSGNVFTVTSVSNPSIATVTIASSSVGTSVYAGTQNVLVSQWNATVNNSPVWLKSLNFTVVGSANKTDIRNVKLLINGTQVGSTLATVDSSGSAYFDLSASPAKLLTGSTNIQVYADVMGSPSFNFDFGILNTYDVYAVDTQYNVPVSVAVNGGGTGSTSGHQITINQGQITVTADTNTPTGNIALGASGATLAKFDIYAAGEPVRVKFLDVKFVTGTGNATSSMQNIYLVDDAGIQIGTTIGTIAAGSSSGQCGTTQTGTTLDATGTFYCHFGTSSSNINYTIPANTTRVISVKSDVNSTATFASVTASLPGNTSNLQGVTSAQTASSGSASGASLTVSSTPLSTTKNTAFSSPTYAAGAAGVRIGSFNLSASSAEGENIFNITVAMSASSTDFQNVKLMYGGAPGVGTQYGTTKATMSGSDSLTFSGNLNIAAGTSKTVDVYADVLSSATGSSGLTSVTTLSSCSGNGATTNASASCSPTSVAGQNVTISSGATVSASIGSDTAPTKQVVMGSTANNLAAFRFAETSNLENVKITDINLTDTIGTASAPSGFNNVTLTCGNCSGASANTSATAAASSSGTTAYIYKFHFATAPIVPQNSSIELYLTGDAAPYNGQTDNVTHTFSSAATTTVTAIGAADNTTATVSGTPGGNTVTILRGQLTVSGSLIGATTGRTRSAVDNLANLVLSATGYDTTVNTINLKFQGTAVSNGIGAFAVDLIDPNTGTDWSGGGAQNCTPGTGNSCTVSFTYTGSNISTITSGTSKTLTVRVNSTNFISNSSTFPNPSVSLTISSTTDVNWGDGSTTNGLALQATAVPVAIANASY